MKLTRILLSLMLFGAALGAGAANLVEVTLTADAAQGRPAGMAKAEQSLSTLLSEINRAQRAGDNITMNNIAMDEFAKKSLARIWDVTPFYCDDVEVVERCWVFSDGNMMVQHIPLIIKPKDEAFGDGTFQEAVVEFDAAGKITDFRFALNAQMSESMERGGTVADREMQMKILQYVERFRTAYNMKDIETIEAMFSDDALIITGKVTLQKAGDGQFTNKISYNKQSKQEYIRNLRKAFARNKWIDVKFTQIGERGESGVPGITQSRVDPTKFGVRLHQSWRSSNYSDEGYLFLLWEFPEDGSDPIIHVRTWQPEWVGSGASRQQMAPDDNISTLGAFDL